MVSLSYFDDWEDVVHLALYAYRTAVHATTGVTPYYCLYGHEAPTNLEWLFPGFDCEREVLKTNKLVGLFDMF